MAGAATPERRRKVSRISQHEVATAAPSLVVLIKRLAALVDALAAGPKRTLALQLTRDWKRMFLGCRADQNRARFSIYRRQRAELLVLHAELDALI